MNVLESIAWSRGTDRYDSLEKIPAQINITPHTGLLCLPTFIANNEQRVRSGVVFGIPLLVSVCKFNSCELDSLEKNRENQLKIAIDVIDAHHVPMRSFAEYVAYHGVNPFVSRSKQNEYIPPYAHFLYQTAAGNRVDDPGKHISAFSAYDNDAFDRMEVYPTQRLLGRYVVIRPVLEKGETIRGSFYVYQGEDKTQETQEVNILYGYEKPSSGYYLDLISTTLPVRLAHIDLIRSAD